MSIVNRIKADQVQARKDRAKEKAVLLTTLYSEFANIGLNDGKRETTDAEAIAMIKKFISNVKEVIAAQPSDELNMELSIYESYLPQQLSEDELTRIVADIVSTLESPSVKDMGKVMGQLKTNHAGLYDGTLASKIVKEQLANS